MVKPAAKPTILDFSFHPPFNFNQVTGFLKPGAIPGVEHVNSHTYCRSITMDNASGFVALSCPEKSKRVRLEIRFSDSDKLPFIANTVKQIFDLNAPAKKKRPFSIRKTTFLIFGPALIQIRIIIY